MSGSDKTEYRCVECGDRDNFEISLKSDEDYAAVLAHYLDHHPEGNTLRETVSGSFVETLCADCEQPFFSPVSIVWDEGGECLLSAESFCPDCVNLAMGRKLVERTLPPLEFVKFESETFEDELTRTEPNWSSGTVGENGD